VKKKIALLVLSLCLVFAATSQIVYAADNDISDGIVVDSTDDTPDQNPGDGTCDDGAGACTLRAAIEEANTSVGTQTIEFGLTGGSDFTNSGEDGYTISPQSTLPQITAPLIINGYTQLGAQRNTAISPNPLNGILLIEIDGSNLVSGTAFEFMDGSDGSEVRGLVVNSFADGDGFRIYSDDVVIQGNYIGTDPTGSSALPNTVGVNAMVTDPSSGADALIGGLEPEDRNLISGNTSGPTATGGYPGTRWVIQGNYVGVAADGVTAIPNSTSNGSGAFSIDETDGVLVGGTSPGATNVISGNISYGLAPLESTNLTVQGNLIGTDWTGTQAVPNLVGITMGGDHAGTLIGGDTAAARNIISGNTIGGIISGGTDAPHIAGNYVGLDITGTVPIPNGFGILVAEDGVVGGSAAYRNVVSGNTLFNIAAQAIQTPASGIEISGNYIGTNAQGNVDPAITNVQGEGIRVSGNADSILIGGTAGNLIAGNRGSGVAVRQITVTSFSLTGTPNNVSILGNQIYNNFDGGPVTGAAGLGIDIYEATVATVSFPADLFADSYVNLGPTPNDAGDSDTGPNNYINFPVLNTATQIGNELNINLDLDATGSTLNDEYRVEFFANDVADASGFGEGQTYLGFVNASNGSGQNLTLQLPNGTDLTGKVISATTTALLNTGNGFGSTSEFSEISDVNVLSSSGGNGGNGVIGSLPMTGANGIAFLIASSLGLMLVGFVIAKRTRMRRLLRNA